MLYSKTEIEHFTNEDRQAAISRYLYKIEKNETRKFYPHECEYLCIALLAIYKNDNFVEPAYNIYELPFLAEALFKRLILLYLDNYDFLEPVNTGTKKLRKEEIARDKKYFYESLIKWRQRLYTSRSGDQFIHEIKEDLKRKIHLLNEQFKAGYFGRRLFERNVLEQDIAAFYKYFIVKAYFKNLKDSALVFVAGNNTFSINIYSYVHVLSRHYMPQINSIHHDKSFNDDLPFIDVFNLPTSLRDLITTYFTNLPHNNSQTKEHIIFAYKNSFYIIRIKFKKLPEIANELGFEIRTLYKIQKDRDLKLIDLNKFYDVNKNLRFYY